MAKRGRKPRLTDETSKKFCEAIAGGLSIKRSADLIGVDQRSVFRWIEMGRKGEGGAIYSNFVVEIKKSEARFIDENLKSVRRAAKPRKTRITKTITRADGSSTTEVQEKIEYDWAASRWLLECKDRESFGPDRHEIAALKKDMAELQKLLAKTLDRVGGQADQGDQAGHPKTAPARSDGGSGNPVGGSPADPSPPAG